MKTATRFPACITKWSYLIVSTLILIGPGADLFAQVRHTYPRTAVQHFGKAPAEWYAKFDLNLVIWAKDDKARKVKQINPKSLLVWVDGWTSFGERNWVHDYIPKDAPQYFVKESSGDKIELNWGELLDMSNLCPTADGGRYNQRHPKYLAQLVDLNVYDGIGSDWCWGRPHNTSDIDLDRNGRNDYEEHGRNWVDKRWLEGVEEFIANLRKEIGPNKLIWVNSGQFHDWGWKNSNGLEIERQSGFLSWDFYWRRYKQFMRDAREPHALLMDVRPNSSDPNKPKNSKNYFQLMRFMLTATMLGDGYFNFSPVEAGEHHFQMYYDEFDLDLGYPTEDAQQLSNGAYVRFFDKGVSIVNPTGSTITVSDGDLMSLQGYRGPYNRFKGGQQPDFNNGNRFDAIELWGGYHKRSKGDILLGDGIILLDHERTVVSDVLVDNNDLDTSAGSKPASLTSLWQQTDDGDDYWNQKVRPSKGWYPHVFVDGGDGSEKATFTPNIGIPGKYEVLEWHGSVDGRQMASKVPHTIFHAEGRTMKYVDQRKNNGRLNSLGIYTFTKGESGKVVISNDASGTIVADMILFKFRGEDGNLDTVAPAAPTGVAVKNE